MTSYLSDLIALTRSQLKVARRKNAASPSMEFASGLSVAVVIFVGGWQIVHGYSDVGGFFDNPSEDLFKDWFNLGIFYVFFRGHSALNTKRREFWLFGTKRERRAINI